MDLPVCERVLGLHPTDRGFGWIVLEGATNPLDWGVVDRRDQKNEKCLSAVRHLLKRYAPAIIALEVFEPPTVKRGTRIVELYRHIAALAVQDRVGVRVYSRQSIRAVFAAWDTPSRHSIALAVGQKLEPLVPRLPKKRAIWENEPANIALFAAAACALTYYALAEEADQP